MPRHYRKVEIKYSRFGVEDFDFEYVPLSFDAAAMSDLKLRRFYNKTKYSGLETHISNSYTNSLLQALHYTLPVRIVAKAHIAQDCPKESCLLCEAGFLFRMLEDAKGINCQASNFSRAFSSSTQGASTSGCCLKDTGLSVYSWHARSPRLGGQSGKSRLCEPDSKVQSLVDDRVCVGGYALRYGCPIGARDGGAFSQRRDERRSNNRQARAESALSLDTATDADLGAQGNH